MFSFESTADLDPLEQPLGQERAVEAAEFAVALDRPGYDLFVFGPSGFGKHAFVKQILDRAAAAGELPMDHCYVHDFERGHAPQGAGAAAGRGRALVRDMQKLMDDLRATIRLPSRVRATAPSSSRSKRSCGRVPRR